MATTCSSAQALAASAGLVQGGSVSKEDSESQHEDVCGAVLETTETDIVVAQRERKRRIQAAQKDDAVCGPIIEFLQGGATGSKEEVRKMAIQAQLFVLDAEDALYYAPTKKTDETQLRLVVPD